MMKYIWKVIKGKHKIILKHQNVSVTQAQIFCMKNEEKLNKY